MLKRLIPHARKICAPRQFSFAHKLVEKDQQELFLDRENCILVNENDEEIGSTSKRDCHKVRKFVIKILKLLERFQKNFFKSSLKSFQIVHLKMISDF